MEPFKGTVKGTLITTHEPPSILSRPSPLGDSAVSTAARAEHRPANAPCALSATLNNLGVGMRGQGVGLGFSI